MNNTVSPEFVERFQIMYQQDPGSKVFAPLAEAYRRMGMLDDALKVSEKGVKLHPSFPGGHLALAKVYLDMGRLSEGAEQLKYVTELSPENILAHQLLADALLKLKRPREALTSFKAVLFLNPNDERAQKTIQRLESLTADEYEEEVFEMTKLPNAFQSSNLHAAHTRDLLKIGPPNDAVGLQRHLERMLSLTDAFIARNDMDRASETLDSTEKELGPHPGIQRRRSFLLARAQTALELDRTIEQAQNTKIQKVNAQVTMLSKLLDRVENRRRD